MSRDTFDYTHADVGSKPSNALNFIKGGRPNAGHFDWFWYNVIQAIKGHADEFDRLDSNDDGVVDAADHADKATDADTVDGKDATAFASAGHLHDNRYLLESGDELEGPLTLNDGSEAASKSWVNTNADVSNADYADSAGDADTIDGYDIQKNGTDGSGIINFKT